MNLKLGFYYHVPVHLENNKLKISGLLGVVGGFLNNGKQMQGVAGIGQVNDEAILILDSLIKKGVSLEHLRKLDAMTNTKLQSLLIML